MNEFERKSKLADQIENQYLSIGKFVVNFEHLFSAIKFKIAHLCGWSQETHVLLEPFSVRQTIAALEDIITLKLQTISVDEKDVNLYKFLIKDLNDLNDKRNVIIHTTWLIGWQNKSSTDVSQFIGHKFSSQLNKKYKTYSAAEIDLLTNRCKTLYSVFYTVWPIDIHLPQEEKIDFYKLYNRDSERNWNEIKN